MLEAIAELVEKEVRRQLENLQTTRLGTITDVNGPKVRFDGENAASGKAYKYVKSYSPVLNDRVLLLKVGNSWMIICRFDGALVGEGLYAPAGSYAPGGYGLGEMARLVSGDWNNQTKSGFYMGSSMANKPPKDAGANTDWEYVLVISHNENPGWTWQLSMDFAGVNFSSRVRANGAWGAWKKITMV